jgi:hypothetical protein
MTNYFKVNNPYQGIMANNKKGIRVLSKNKSKHFFKNRLHDNYKSSVHQLNAFFVGNVDRVLNQNKDCKFGHDTVSNKISNSNSMFLAPITEDEILNVTIKLKGKFSVGYDEIPEKLVKESIQFIKKPLTLMFNTSLCSGNFPNLMKFAKVRPIHKKGRKQEISN